MSNPFSATGAAFPIQDVRERRIPIAPVVITSTSSASPTEIFTVPENRTQAICSLENFNALNTLTTSADLTVYMVPDGASVGGTYLEIFEFSVPAKTALRIEDIMSGSYSPGTTCYAYASSVPSIVLRGTLRQER